MVPTTGLLLCKIDSQKVTPLLPQTAMLPAICEIRLITNLKYPEGRCKEHDLQSEDPYQIFRDLHGISTELHHLSMNSSTKVLNGNHRTQLQPTYLE